MNAFDLKQLPKGESGRLLLEASAGTGKTYTLVSIYLHYLVERQLPVEAILVVTFTEAATREMKQRIHERVRALLHAATQVKAGRESILDAQIEEVDRYLLSYLAEDGDCFRHLLNSTKSLDRADIQTIHGFCYQILSQYPLETGSPIGQLLEEDLSALRLSACVDFWRSEVITQHPEVQGFAHATLGSPEALLNQLNSILSRRPDRIYPADRSTTKSWIEVYHDARKRCQDLQDCLLEHSEAVADWLATGAIKRPKDKQRWWQQLIDWANAKPTQVFVPASAKKQNLFDRFRPERMIEELKANHEIPSAIQDSVFEKIADALDRGGIEVDAYLTSEAIIWVRQQYQNLKERLEVADFDDLVMALSNRLADKDQLADLRSRISKRYRLALIDEFQDTDPHQFGIFSSLFEAAQLIMIGDPKQAIYAFRGGDIATYLQAKNLAQDGVFSLDTNYRSTQNMVASINHLFGMHNTPFVLPGIEFDAAKAHSEERQGGLCFDAVPGRESNKSDLYDQLATVALHRVLSAIEMGTDIEEMVVLVRQASEAHWIRKRFALAGIDTHFSGRTELHLSSEARSMLKLLRVLGAPEDELLLRQFIADPDWFIEDQDIEHFGSTLKIQLWRVLNWANVGQWRVAIHAIFVHLEAVPRWNYYLKAESFAERMQNWEALIASLESIAEECYTLSQVIRSFARELISPKKICNANSTSEKQLRIITIHKSKGLEFDTVFIPFLFSSLEGDKGWFYEQDEKGSSSLVFDAGDQSCLSDSLIRQNEQASLAEDARLLYVALTRAKTRCFVGTALYQGGRGRSLGFEDTALGRLLLNGSDGASGDLEDEDFKIRLQSLPDAIQSTWWDARAVDSLVDKIPAQRQLGFSHTATGKYSLKASAFSRYFNDAPQQHSFSSLLREHHQMTQIESAMDQSGSYELEFKLMFESDALPNQSISTSNDGRHLNILSFPKGATAGTFLHKLFEVIEWGSQELIAELGRQFDGLIPWIEYELKAADLFETEAVEQWSTYLSQWLKSILDIELMADFRLKDLRAGSYQREMPFVMSVKGTQIEKINALLADSIPGWVPMKWRDFSGLLVGSIDLLFEFNGQFYVADYKSNYLGDEVANYDDASMHTSMLDHHYILQYVIYMLALHRLLKNRMDAEYEPERHLGGVIYLFLRGLQTGQKPPDATLSQHGIYRRQVSGDLITKLDDLMNDGMTDGVTDGVTHA